MHDQRARGGGAGVCEDTSDVCADRARGGDAEGRIGEARDLDVEQEEDSVWCVQVRRLGVGARGRGWGGAVGGAVRRGAVRGEAGHGKGGGRRSSGWSAVSMGARDDRGRRGREQVRVVQIAVRRNKAEEESCSIRAHRHRRLSKQHHVTCAWIDRDRSRIRPVGILPTPMTVAPRIPGSQAVGTDG